MQFNEAKFNIRAFFGIGTFNGRKFNGKYTVNGVDISPLYHSGLRRLFIQYRLLFKKSNGGGSIYKPNRTNK